MARERDVRERTDGVATGAYRQPGETGTGDHAVNKKSAPTSQWSTPSFGSAPNTTPMELAALGEHMNRCGDQRGAWFGWKCAVDAWNGFAAPRLITTLVVVGMIVVVGSLLV
jgi:hypothetical protein